MRSRAGRLLAGGLATAVAVGFSGRALDRARFGSSDEEALGRVEAEVRRQFSQSAEALAETASRVAAASRLISAARRDPSAAPRLFEVVARALPPDSLNATGITVYDAAANRPVAWAGRVSDLAKPLINGPASLFVAPGALGPRLVRVEPVGSAGSREATIVVEQSIAGLPETPGLADTAVVSTPLAPVTIRMPVAGGQSAGRPGPSRTDNFVIRSPKGGALVEAEVGRADLAAARARWRGLSWAAVLAVLAGTLLLSAGPLVDFRRRARTVRQVLFATVGVALILIVARDALLIVATEVGGSQPLASPANLLLSGLAAAGLAWLVADTVERRRAMQPRARLLLNKDPHAIADARVAALYFGAGIIAASVVAAYELFLGNVVARTDLDVLHFSLHPMSSSRVAVGFGLLLLHAAVVWGAATVIHACGVFWRMPRRWSLQATAVLGWLAGAGLAAILLHRRWPAIPLVPLCVSLGACGACAVALTRLPRLARRASEAARLVALFTVVVVPALAMYPSLLSFASAAKEQLIATQYAPLAKNQRRDLQEFLYQALDQIDALPTLVDFVKPPADRSTPSTARAYAVWSNTDLARYRLTSAVELYSSDGRLLSRFSNLPEYATASHNTPGCDWELFEEVLPFGSSERHVPRASRGICEHGVLRGSIVVRVMLDYRTPTSASSQNPYLESLRPDQASAPEDFQAHDVEFVEYGWSRAPVYTSGTGAWPLTDEVFQRTVESRDSFWTTLTRDGAVFRVYLMNDRGGIYALGYPPLTWFGHLVNLAELIVLIGVLYALLVAGGGLFSAVASTRPARGRALLREFRSSFYRKLWLAYVFGAVVPVVILAAAVRTYFATQARAGEETTAARTATVAQRLVEDYATLQQRGTTAVAPIDDQIMVLIRRVINQDVNLYERSSLEASSQRDLFESGLFSMRTPSAVYRQVVLERLPTFVGIDQVANFPYRVAAAPVRAGGRDGIVVVPLPLGQQDLDRQIDELDRQVIFGAVLFSLLGAGIGYWLAERIADPINRLSHATRRIAHGDLDAHIARASADELGRLVEDFNRMADDLKRQRTELERTQRLEAWADMARQVAHDIKNPLTPIQLSAEHAQRVNLDRGRPLSPVLDECIHAILTQVSLLRQIAAEFSSFASRPVARREPTAVPDLLESVVAPYRTGLAGRIAVDVDAPGDLPSAILDRTLFSRALTNVIENALHAMPGRGRLSIRAAGPDGADRRFITVEITDTGIGMDDEARARIFEPYFSTKATGTGLGLTIAKRNVELNGGTIAVTSERGVGTTVTITLPVA